MTVDTAAGQVHANVAAALARARSAQPAWAATPLVERARVARRLAHLVLERETEILDVIQAETGKNRRSAFEELADVALGAAWVARHAPRLLAPSRRAGAIPLLTKTVTTPCPHGVLGLITPWNYPFTLPVNDAIPALVAGNAVVLKPDSATRATAELARDLMVLAGIPEDVLVLVTGPGPDVGQALIPNVDAVQFTGSSASGRTVAETAGRNLVPFFGELGGKNAMLVLADADVPRAARGAVRACFANSGQLCVSIERIYVHRDVAPEFTAAFLAQVRAMRVGPGADWDIDMGSLISTGHLDRVMAHVEDAISRGATVLAGGRRRPDLGPGFMDPTVLTGVPPEADLVRAETFGPVVNLVEVADEDEAVARANDSEYGLTACVFSRHHGERVAARLHAGSVSVNEAYSAAWGSHGAPIGGWGDSGSIGRHGPEGLLKYTRPRTVARQRLLELGPGQVLGASAYQAVLRRAVRLLTHWR